MSRVDITLNLKSGTFLIVFLISNLIFCQEKLADNFSFRFISTTKNNRIYFSTSTYYINVPDEEKRIEVRFKMKSVSGEKENFDPNKLYLLSEEYKFRLRPIDVKHNYGVGMVYIGFGFLLDFPPQSKTLKKWANYKPNIKDTFLDYKINGFQDISCSIDFGTKKEPNLVLPYFDHKKLRSCKIEVYFSIPSELEKGKVYYGDNVIADFEL